MVRRARVFIRSASPRRLARLVSHGSIGSTCCQDRLSRGSGATPDRKGFGGGFHILKRPRSEPGTVRKADGNDKALGLRRVESLDELLAQADVLSLHCPLSPESRAMINDRTLALMKRSSILLNTARGGLVDTTAVLSAIESGQLSGAGIDVLPMEPPPSGDPLIAAWRNPDHVAHHRVIINPHSAFYSEAGLMDMRIKGAEACRRALLGLPLRNVVNQPASVRPC